VVLAVASVLEIDPAIPLRVATPFCSGLSRTSGLCGAISGGVIGIGLALGRDEAEASVDPSYQATRLLIEGFTERFGATGCTELTGCDLSTEEGRDAFPRSGARQRCTEYVMWASDRAGRLALGDDAPTDVIDPLGRP
jgi:C_GCAxxG_C_C family probable redox protein